MPVTDLEVMLGCCGHPLRVHASMLDALGRRWCAQCADYCKVEKGEGDYENELETGP